MKIIKHALAILFICFTFSKVLNAQIGAYIPSERRVDWSNAGYMGSSTTRTNISRTVTGSESASEHNDNVQHSNSWISAYGAMGALELGGLGIQCSISPHQIIGIKYSGYITNGKGFIVPITGVGPGITWTYFTGSGNLFNAFNAEFTYMYKIARSDHPKYGLGTELTAGHKNYHQGFHLFWLVGISASFIPNTPALHSPADLYSPAIKFGANYNF